MSEKQNGSIEPWLLYKTAKETPDRKSPAFPDQMCLKKFFTKAEMTGKAFFRHISKGEKNMRKERWVVSAKRADFQAIADRFKRSWCRCGCAYPGPDCGRLRIK